MVGPKLNDGALLVADDRVTTKATAKYVRGSASKVREVLDLIRGLDVRRADEVLQFTARDAAQDIRKVLTSAVANAVHNDEQDPDELYVVACYADEGPTLRRFRPRAKGRATRIRKRTCHITVVVTRLSDERLDVLQARHEARQAEGRRRPGGTVRSRRDRVERSRTRAQALREGAESDEQVTDAPVDSEDEAGAAEGSASDEAEASEPKASETIDTAEPESSEPEASETIDTVDLPQGAVLAPEDGSVPAGYPIKGNANSMLYHQPGGRYYDVTIAEVFFDTPENAEAAGYSAPASEES